MLSDQSLEGKIAIPSIFACLWEGLAILSGQMYRRSIYYAFLAGIIVALLFEMCIFSPKTNFFLLIQSNSLTKFFFLNMPWCSIYPMTFFSQLDKYYVFFQLFFVFFIVQNCSVVQKIQDSCHVIECLLKNNSCQIIWLN